MFHNLVFIHTQLYTSLTFKQINIHTLVGISMGYYTKRPLQREDYRSTKDETFWSLHRKRPPLWLYKYKQVCIYARKMYVCVHVQYVFVYACIVNRVFSQKKFCACCAWFVCMYACGSIYESKYKSKTILCYAQRGYFKSSNLLGSNVDK